MSRHYERRSICVEEMIFNSDGSVQKLPWWSAKGVTITKRTIPYKTIWCLSAVGDGASSNCLPFLVPFLDAKKEQGIIWVENNELLK